MALRVTIPVLEKFTAITGLGQSATGRRLGRPAFDLTIDACLAAIADAGLSPKDIDGLASWPGKSDTPGFSPVGLDELKNALGLELNWYSAGVEGPGQFTSVANACAVIAAGYARHVLCFRTVWESSAQAERLRVRSDPNARVTGRFQWQIPFHAYSAANWIAMMASRHFHEYGTTREQLGAIAVNSRRNAGLNPKAVYREPMELDDYLSARMISTPLCLFDCDVPIDGSTAVVVSSLEAARDLRRPVVRFEAVGCALRGRDSWDQFDDLASMAARDAAAMMWSRTDLKPRDLRIAELYDGFSYLALSWLEALGVCGKGEGGAYVDGGARIALEGELPLNTNGGQLSEGRLHGLGFLHEACLQLRGDGAARQVRGEPKVAVAAAGGGPYAASLLLVRD